MSRAEHDGDGLVSVHGSLTAEYYPYARSGGLAEAVANLARYQSAEGVRSLALLPLYRSAREAAGPLVPLGPPWVSTKTWSTVWNAPMKDFVPARRRRL